jgi:hypothetical protein
MDPEEVYRLMMELSAASNVRELTHVEVHALADLVIAMDGWLSQGGFLPKAWRKWREDAKASDEKASVVVKPLSLGEQPHSPADCYMYRGRPHLGACLDAEGFTRWYWMEGPGAEPMSSTQIALAMQRLVAEAFEAREKRTRGPLSGIEPTEPTCPFTFAHTRHWCGYPECRDA